VRDLGAEAQAVAAADEGQRLGELPALLRGRLWTRKLAPSWMLGNVSWRPGATGSIALS
jgi:hypothetical protein